MVQEEVPAWAVEPGAKLLWSSQERAREQAPEQAQVLGPVQAPVREQVRAQEPVQGLALALVLEQEPGQALVREQARGLAPGQEPERVLAQEPARERAQALGQVPGRGPVPGQALELERVPERVLVRLLLWLWWSVQSSPQSRALSPAQQLSLPQGQLL